MDKLNSNKCKAQNKWRVDEFMKGEAVSINLWISENRLLVRLEARSEGELYYIKLYGKWIIFKALVGERSG